MPCSGSSALHGVNPNLKRYGVMYPEIFWGDFLAGGLGGVGDCDAPLWMGLCKALVGTRWQSSWKLQGFSTLKSLPFD